MTLLAMQQVRFRYGSRDAIRSCSLAIPSHTFFGLLGPNGAGKTTLLKLMAGLLAPQEGTITLHNHPLRALSARERTRQIAFVPQVTTELYPMRVREVIALGRTPYHTGLSWQTSADHAAIGAAMRLMQCTQWADRYLHTLSSGERQRVLIARALAQQPTLLLLDEPIAHLDPAVQLDVLHALRHVHATCGTTIGITIHDISLAMRHCDMLGLLSHGTVDRWGATAMVATPEHLSAAFQTPIEWTQTLTAGIAGHGTSSSQERT